MDVAAKLSSKGQITLPKVVREALDLHEGDQVVFRVDQGRAVLIPARNFLDLAASIPVPEDRRGVEWDEVRDAVRRERVGRRW